MANTESALKKIGRRGLVVHSEDKGGSFLVLPDNKTKSWRSYQVPDLAALARKRELDTKKLDVLIDAGAPVGVFVGKKDEELTVFLNLDALTALQEPKEPGALAEREALPEGTLYLIYEDEQYYAVEETLFDGLENVDAGEAKILVRRGAVVAAIPDNAIPYGTNCVLVNLSQLLEE